MPHASVCAAIDLSDDGESNQSSVGTACSFDYDGNTFGGVCYLSGGGSQLCVPACQPPALDQNGNFVGGDPIVACADSEVTCEAVGITATETLFGACPGDYEYRECGNGLIEPYGGESCDDGNTLTEQCDHNQRELLKPPSIKQRLDQKARQKSLHHL